MKLKFFPLFKHEGEVVASWGDAQLVKYLDGKTELRGGSKQDRAEAREWMSMFWHEAVVGWHNRFNFELGMKGIQQHNERAKHASVCRLN